MWVILRTVRTCLETEWKIVSFLFVCSQSSVWQANPFELAQLDHIVSQSIDMRYQFHLLTFEVSYAYFPFSWILSWLSPQLLFTIANAYFSLFISLEQQMKCRKYRKIREKLKNVKLKTKNQKQKTPKPKNQNEIQPEANVNKVQSDVCFCQKTKRGESKNTEYFDLCTLCPPLRISCLWQPPAPHTAGSYLWHAPPKQLPNASVKGIEWISVRASPHSLPLFHSLVLPPALSFLPALSRKGLELLLEHFGWISRIVYTHIVRYICGG